MPYQENAPRIPLDQIVWSETGEESGDPKTRLLGHIKIGPLDMHLEAYEVDTDEHGEQSTKIYPEDYDAISTLAGGPFETVEIDGREYILIAYPFSA